MNTLALLLLGLMAAPQDGWRDTHRVHLRNGNFLDGVLVQLGEKDILFRWSPGILMRIKVADIRGDVEEIKIRTLNSEPKRIAIRETPPPADGTSGTSEAPLPRDPSKAPSEIDKLFARLMSQPDMTYEILVREVKALGSDGAKSMIQELPHMDAQKTNLALVALDQMRDLPVEGDIRALLDSPRSDLRAAACNLLANRGAEGSLRSIQALLRDPVPQVRVAALMAMPVFGDPTTLEPVANLAVDPEASVRLRAIRSSEDLASRVSLDNDLAQRWLSLMGRGPVGTQGEIAVSLGRLADRANDGFPADPVRDRLASMLSDREAEARAAAAYSLSSLRPPGPAADLLLAAFEVERDPKVIVSLCDALGRLRIHKTIEPLVEKLRDRSAEVQSAAQRALEKISGQTEFGSDYDQWREWFDRTRTQKP